MTIDQRPIQPDKARFDIIVRWLEKRPFSELKCLMKSSDKLHRIYGFILTGIQYMDSLKGLYEPLLDDTTSLQVQTDHGIIDTKISIATFLKPSYDLIVKDNQNLKKRPLIEEKVSSFIKNYSLHPETYRSISFPYFSMGAARNEGATAFRIRHQYQLKDREGQLVTITSQFSLDSSLVIFGIARDSSNRLYSYSLMLADWLNDYGRKLNRQDSIDLHLNYQAPYLKKDNPTLQDR